MENFENELKVEFLIEAAQSLADTEQCFLMLETEPDNADNLNKIFRLAHNLKGSSNAVGFTDMGAFTHEFESFILKIKNGHLKATPAVVSLLLKCNDYLIKMVETLKENLEARFDSSELLNEMKNSNHQDESLSSTEPESSPEAAPTQEQPILEFTPELESAIEAAVVSQSTPSESVPSSAVELEPNLELLAELEAELALTQKKSEKPNVAAVQPSQALGKTEAVKSATQPQAEESIRVSITKLENLLNYVGEMVILQSVMREQAHSTDSLLLKKTVQQLGKVGKEIQDISMSLRMIPVKQTFQKMQRIVRDTAAALKKDVGIKLVGEETELDKTVLEKINDPLVHLIRNSVDHGIETKDIRISRGKSEKGNVTLSAFHQSGKLVIEVKDDGGGLNPEKLIAKAIEKGIVKPGAQMSAKEAYNLIFAPGFSTKEQVTDVSGRGVGMDVVRTNIKDLSGEIQIDSEIGKGTTFRIILPLTLAIIDGMIITFAEEKYVVPLNHVHETMRPTEKQIQFVNGIGDVLLLRGENIPLFRLGDFFGKKSMQKSTDMIAMVIRSGNHPFALLVDDILGQYQVVIKQLGPELSQTKGISGSTILGDGKPALILEPLDLFKRSRAYLGQDTTKKVIKEGSAA